MNTHNSEQTGITMSRNDSNETETAVTKETILNSVKKQECTGRIVNNIERNNTIVHKSTQKKNNRNNTIHSFVYTIIL